jgi:hypothetical protein
VSSQYIAQHTYQKFFEEESQSVEKKHIFLDSWLGFFAKLQINSNRHGAFFFYKPLIPMISKNEKLF